ncbi:3380_t:CDS:2 [Funneliformis geosporum]|uniref:3366_t:CDS:1 n=1 Tax=Funneliformis geosporum TaxID=1117311 RepID=A0A9W4X0Y8_9GLOM|nr:3380_t:CDS:2 [Funneliformis geosporum]CAI2178378.1 3366_t:CDS:2 [Funneliformis geosporum]
MRFCGYVLEILVNDVPLPERPIKVESDQHINFEPSFYVDNITKQKVFCEMHYVVEVKVPESEFKVRFRSLKVTKDRQIRGDVVMDGEIDETCIEMYDRSFQVVNGFWRKKIHEPFKFPSNLWPSSTLTSNIPNSANQLGGLGAISVYFYEIERVKFPTVKNLNTSSKNFNYLFWNGSSKLKSYDPIAVLHIHYRSTSWFDELLNSNKNNYHRRQLRVETSAVDSYSRSNEKRKTLVGIFSLSENSSM